MDQHQKQIVQNYQRLHSFFRGTLKSFNLDFFNDSRDFRFRNLFFILTLLISYYFNILNVVKSYNEVIRLVWTFNLAWFVVHFMAITKGFTFIYNKKEFLNLLEEIGELYSTNYSKLISTLQHKNLEENLKLNVLALIVYGVVFWFTEFLALAYLFSLPEIQYPMIYELPIVPESYAYLFNMILQFYIYFLILTIVMFGDLFVILFGFHFRCELKTICELCETYLNDCEIFNNEQNLLREIYEKHEKMIRMLETLDEIYKHLSFYQILASFVCCCFLFYGTLVQEEFEGSLYMLVLIAVIQLFTMCLFGETLVANTEQVGLSIYLTKWYEMTVTEQMNLLFIMRIAQKPHGIKAAGLINVNFFTFVESMKGAVSYCAILYALTN